MILGVAPVAGSERFTAVGVALLNGQIRVPKHDGLCLTALASKHLEFFPPVPRFTFLNAVGFVDLHIF